MDGTCLHVHVSSTPAFSLECEPRSGVSETEFQSVKPRARPTMKPKTLQSGWKTKPTLTLHYCDYQRSFYKVEKLIRSQAHIIWTPKNCFLKGSESISELLDRKPHTQ